jgi:H+/Cl- antiporter ClcA
LPTNDTHQQLLLHRLERVLMAFFLLAALFLLVVYMTAPSLYTETLLLQPSPTDRYPLAVTLFLLAILAFIAVLIVGVLQHWHWLFWLQDDHVTQEMIEYLHNFKETMTFERRIILGMRGAYEHESTTKRAGKRDSFRATQ